MKLACLRPSLLVCTLALPALTLPLLTLPLLILTGCGTALTSAPLAAPAGGAGALTLTGRVKGGQQPITGALISLYSVGTTGYGTGSASMLTTPVRSDPNGNFSITNDYSCGSGNPEVYLVARGGNPGLTAGTDNPAIVLMAPLGPCNNLFSTTFLTVNELTTAASAWALAQFIGPGANIGAPASNATGLSNAFLVANTVVNVAQGTAGGATLPATATLESAKMNALADALSVCVNSTGGAYCAPLFNAATVNGIAPGNIFDAAVNIVRNPGQNVAAVWSIINAQAPFVPSLAQAPNDWTLSVTYRGGGLYAPTGLAVDATGAVWAANYFGQVASKFSVLGAPFSATGYTDPHLNENYGITVDATGSAWISNEESPGVNGGGGSITKFSASGTLLSGNGFFAGGVYFPYSLAADTNSSIWIGDFGRSKATLLASDGSSLSGSGGFTPSNLPFPIATTVDGSHNAWFAGQGIAAQVTPAGVTTAYNCCRAPAGITLDPTGNVWIADYSASSLVQLTPAGATNQRLSTGGVQGPESVIADGTGQVWMTNYRGNTISGFSPVTAAGATSTALSPATGFGVDAGLSEPFGIAPDPSGNLWVANFASDTLTQFVGLASPTRSPRLGLPSLP